MKKILLMTPAHPASGTSPMHFGDGRPMLGLGFLAAYVEQFGHKVKILDNFIRSHNIAKEIEESNLDFVGVYVNTTSFLMAVDLLKKIRNLTSAKIICGGPHVTLNPGALENYADYLVVGEGEIALLDILEGRAEGKLVRRELIQDLNVLPWPDYRHFINEPYNWRLDLYQVDVQPVVTMNTSRGCPFHCQFCAVKSIWGKRHRCFSATRVVEEIEHLIRKFGVQGIYFREDNFTANRKRLREFCDLMEDKQIAIPWVCETRADLNEETVHRLAKIGCRGFYVGVENGSQRILDMMKKGIKTDQIKNFFKWSRQAGIVTYATIVYGFPGETQQDRDLTEDFLLEIQPDAIDRFAYTGIPGSPIYNYLKDNQLYYHMDESGFIYTENFRQLIPQLCSESDTRVQLLKNQERTLSL